MARKSRFFVPILLFFFCFAIPATVFAQGAALAMSRPVGEWYGMFHMGAVSSSKGNSSWSIYGALGRYFLPNIALEASVGYHSVDYPYGEVTSWPLALSVRAGYPVQQVYPYVIGGVDLQSVKVELWGNSDSDTAFGYHLGAGAEISMSDRTYLGLEYRYTWIEANLFGVTRKLDSGNISVVMGFRF